MEQHRAKEPALAVCVLRFQETLSDSVRYLARPFGHLYQETLNDSSVCS